MILLKKIQKLTKKLQFVKIHNFAYLFIKMFKNCLQIRSAFDILLKTDEKRKENANEKAIYDRY